MFYWLWKGRPCHHVSLRAHSPTSGRKRRRRRPAAPSFQSRTSSLRITKPIRWRNDRVAFKDAAAQGGAGGLRGVYCLSAEGIWRLLWRPMPSTLILVLSGPWQPTLRIDRVAYGKEGKFSQNWNFLVRLMSVWQNDKQGEKRRHRVRASGRRGNTVCYRMCTVPAFIFAQKISLSTPPQWQYPPLQYCNCNHTVSIYDKRDI